jgi:hypothetical protein
VQNHGYLVVHENGSVTKLCSTYMVNRPGTAEYWTKIYPWLAVQVDLFNGKVNFDIINYFHLDRVEHGFPVYRSELGDIEIYFTGDGTYLVEYNFEII